MTTKQAWTPERWMLLGACACFAFWHWDWAVYTAILFLLGSDE
jgi:membrane protease YdiL (CAAX protease family)